ncbi:unnamed protein product, partial [Urochloa humidicola]
AASSTRCRPLFSLFPLSAHLRLAHLRRRPPPAACRAADPHPSLLPARLLADPCLRPPPPPAAPARPAPRRPEPRVPRRRAVPRPSMPPAAKHCICVRYSVATRRGSRAVAFVLSSRPLRAHIGCPQDGPTLVRPCGHGDCIRTNALHAGRRATPSSQYVPPTVAETKLNFLKSYKRPIPSIYSTLLQELLVQQHLMRYKKTYQYDPVFGLGFVTVYDQLTEGYPSNEDKESIFKAYITALNEDPDQYRADAQKMEDWARSQNGNSLVDFASRDGEIESILKDISERAKGMGNFSYSRFFAVGLFRLLELANATEPTVLDKLCAALNVNKRSVDRDLDVYRNILSKLVQAKELLKEYVDREKKKREERSETSKSNEAVTKFDGNLYSMRH